MFLYWCCKIMQNNTDIKRVTVLTFFLCSGRSHGKKSTDTLATIINKQYWLSVNAWDQKSRSRKSYMYVSYMCFLGLCHSTKTMAKLVHRYFCIGTAGEQWWCKFRVLSKQVKHVVILKALYGADLWSNISESNLLKF